MPGIRGIPTAAPRLVAPARLSGRAEQGPSLPWLLTQRGHAPQRVGHVLCIPANSLGPELVGHRLEGEHEHKMPWSMLGLLRTPSCSTRIAPLPAVPRPAGGGSAHSTINL